MNLLCVAMMTIGAQSINLYVSPTGNDGWSGRVEQADPSAGDGPVRTIEAARDLARKLPKDVPVLIRIASGTYPVASPLMFGPEDSGKQGGERRYLGPTAGNSRAKPAVISGLRRIGGFKLVSGSTWVTTIPEVAQGKWYFSQLFVNHERRYRPRLPKGGYYNIAERIGPTPQSQGKGFDRFQFKPGDIKKSWESQPDVEVLAFHQWGMSRNRIASVDEANSVVTFRGPTGYDQGWADFPKGNRYLVENVKEALSEPGEWYLDRATGELRVIAMPGESLDKAVVEAPVADQLLVVRGEPATKQWVENLRFEGLTFEGTQWNVPEKGRNFPQAEADLGGAIQFSGARDCTVSRCAIARTGCYAVDIGASCKRISIIDNRMVDLGAGGVKVGITSNETDEELLTEKCSVLSNTIEGGGRMHPAAVGVWVGQNPNNNINANVIRDLYYTGISVGWSWGYQENGAHDNHIDGNRISVIGQGVLSDMGGIYTLGPQSGTTIIGNRIHDVTSFSYGGWGIYPDEGSTDILIKNNCVFRTKSAGFHQHYGKQNRIFNNVFAFGKEAQVMRTRAESHLSFIFEYNIVLSDGAPILGSNWTGSGFQLNHNVYWRTDNKPIDFAGMTFDDWQKKGQDRGSIIEDPQFRDPAKGDFRLSPRSPAIAIGFKPFPSLDPAFEPAPTRQLKPAFPTAN